MADFDNTALNSAIKELWDEKVEEARYSKMVIANNITSRSGIAQKKGDVIHVTIDQKYSVGTVSAAGAFTPQNYTPTTVDITLNQWEQVSIRILDRAEAQAFWTPGSIFPRKVGEAFGDRYDAQVASLHASITTQVGSASAPENFSKNLAQEAMLKLAQANIPLEDLSFFINPVSWFNGLLNEVQLTSAADGGHAGNTLITGKVFDMLGVPLYQSSNILTNVGTPNVVKNLLLHKSAIAIAWQKNTEIERFRATPAGILADGFVAQSLYGQSVIRADHGVVINSAP